MSGCFAFNKTFLASVTAILVSWKFVLSVTLRRQTHLRHMKQHNVTARKWQFWPSMWEKYTGPRSATKLALDVENGPRLGTGPRSESHIYMPLRSPKKSFFICQVFYRNSGYKSNIIYRLNCYEHSGKQSFALFASDLTFLKKMRVMIGSSMQ